MSLATFDSCDITESESKLFAYTWAVKCHGWWGSECFRLPTVCQMLYLSPVLSGLYQLAQRCLSLTLVITINIHGDIMAKLDGECGEMQ
jgi:hypothetical protein